MAAPTFQPISTMADLRDYVKAGQTTVPQGYAKFDITHNLLKAQFKEIQLCLTDTIDSIKDRLSRLAGTNIQYMQLLLNGHIELTTGTLQQYNPNIHGDYIHIVDNDPYSNAKNGAYEDLSQVKKYVMSDAEYAKRTDSVRAFKLAQQQQRQADETAGLKAPTMIKTGMTEQNSEFGLETEEQIRQRIHVGDRCSVSPGDRRGVVRYIGLVPELVIPDFVWIGVELDEPVGKHNGMVGGKRYFNAAEKCGTFVKAFAVKTGDYPERDPFDDENEETKESEDVMTEL